LISLENIKDKGPKSTNHFMNILKTLMGFRLN